jgi:DNA-binding PadR family transcriptional regulator
MRLKPSSYLVLGMLNLGVRTGYAVKRTVDRSTRYFWAASLAQVYPELAALEHGGYVSSTDDPHGARPRKAYRLTAKGRASLEAWLRSEQDAHLEFRDEGLLRLFFADSIPLDDAYALIGRLRMQAERIEREFREEILPYAERASSASRRFPLIAAREGADYFGWRAAWFRRIEAELVGELDTRARPSHGPRS